MYVWKSYNKTHCFICSLKTIIKRKIQHFHSSKIWFCRDLIFPARPTGQSTIPFSYQWWWHQGPPIKPALKVTHLTLYGSQAFTACIFKNNKWSGVQGLAHPPSQSQKLCPREQQVGGNNGSRGACLFMMQLPHGPRALDFISLGFLQT